MNKYGGNDKLEVEQPRPFIKSGTETAQDFEIIAKRDHDNLF